MRTTLAILLVLLASAASAGPDRISILLGSKHVDPASSFNEVNPGVFLSWGEELSFSVGTYYNSYEKQSVAATLAYQVAGDADFGLDVFGDVAHYPEDGRRFAISYGDWVPIGGLQLRAGKVFANIIPGDGKEVAAIIGFGLTFQTDDFRR